jgi:hypothetical protein
VVHIKDHNPADRASAKSQVVRSGIDHHALRPANILSGLPSLGKVTTADQQRYVGMSGAQRSGSLVTNGAGTTHEQDRIK